MLTATSQGAAPEQATGLGQTDHDKAMLAKVDGAPAPAAAAATARPEHIPEKFWDAEKGVVKTDEMAKSYAELERAKSTPAEKQEGTPEATPAAIDEAARVAAEAAKAAGGDATKVDFSALSSEFAQSGALSDDSYAKLEKAGLGKDIVDQFIQGQTALAQGRINAAYELVGGQETYSVMLDWGSKNLPAAEVAAFDRAVVSTDDATRTMALTSLKARFDAAVGQDPSLIRPGAKGAGAAAGAYQSRAEVTADMRNPKYSSDPAFRAEVERKLSISNVF